MNPTAAVCPPWLATLLHQAGGTVPFRQFMDWALYHPEHGYYGSGRVRIGPQGDFATSPSLGPDFTTLLARQLIDLLRTLQDQSVRLSLVEVGPGEGDLAAELQTALAHLAPDLIERCEFVLVERSPALRQRQRQRLAGLGGCPVRWCSIEELQASPVQGVVLAHELLDAFPVDRLVVHQGELLLQGVVLAEQDQLAWTSLSLPSPLEEDLKRSGIDLPPPGSDDGWATEWHVSLRPWFASLASAVSDGALLVIDYALEASRYYAARRADGTLMAYRNGMAGLDPLAHAGEQDLTAHLCIETLTAAAAQHDWQLRDQRRQGEALLALGLADHLHALQQLPATDLAQALRRREALLRLVDPAALGDFRWLLFSRGARAERFSLATAPDNAGSHPG